MAEEKKSRGRDAGLSLVSYQTTSVEESVDFCRKFTHLDRLTQLSGAPDDFEYRSHLFNHGPLWFAEVRYQTDVRLDIRENEAKYRISVPVNGPIPYRYRNAEDAADSMTAAIFGPGEPLTVTHWKAGTRLLTAKLDKHTVEVALAAMFGSPVDEPIRFTPAFSMAAAPAASWLWLVRSIVRAADIMTNPLVSAPFADSLARGLLLAGRHTFSERLDRALRVPNSVLVRTAVEFIESNAGKPLTVSEIAGQCRVSSRALQIAFKRHVGVSPMAYLRRVRLGRVYSDLKTSDPATATVTSVAYKWGFSNVGRMATEYRSVYGGAPGETLRRQH